MGKGKKKVVEVCGFGEESIQKKRREISKGKRPLRIEVALNYESQDKEISIANNGKEFLVENVVNLYTISKIFRLFIGGHTSCLNG